jgi:hypothetical protein
VVKKVKNAKGKEVFVPLDESDNNNVPRLSAILLQYQWPMCIGADLDEVEKKALLTPIDPQKSDVFGKQFPQEDFIQNKMTQLIKNANYQIVFIPTSLYELFCIYEYIKTLGQTTPLQKAITVDAIDLSDILSKDLGKKDFFAFSNTIRRQILTIYRNVNKKFFSEPGETNAAFYMNNKIATFLFSTYEEFKVSKDSGALADFITNKADVLVTYLVNEINKYDMSTYDTRRIYRPDLMFLKDESNNNIVPKVIALEYQARALNKGLLFRGTTLITAPVDFGTKEPNKKSEQPTQLLAGSTLKSENVEKEYGQKKIEPYSISFGTSLFAGAMFDGGACAYNYLVGLAGPMAMGKKERTTGYLLLIDKKAYIENQNNNLFFIPPLAPIAGIFQLGEYFHARSKAATLLKKGWEQGVGGLSVSGIQDPTGIFLITRDPLEHAALFSAFVAENARIIQLGDTSSMTEAEKSGILQAQKQSAEFYRNLKTVTKPIQAAIDRRMQKILGKRKKEENQKVMSSIVEQQKKN